MQRIQCPSCGAGLKVSNEAAGKLACPKCKTPIRLSKPERAADAEDEEDDEPKAKKVSKRRKRSSGGVPELLWIALAIGFLFRVLDTFISVQSLSDFEARSQVRTLTDPGLSKEALETVSMKVYGYLLVRWFVAFLCWIAVMMRSDSGRRIMIGLCWLTLVSYAILFAITAGDPVSPNAFKQNLPNVILGSIMSLAIAFLLGQESVKRYTNK